MNYKIYLNNRNLQGKISENPWNIISAINLAELYGLIWLFRLEDQECVWNDPEANLPAGLFKLIILFNDNRKMFMLYLTFLQFDSIK